MATTNTFYSNTTNNGYKLSLEVRQSAQSIANNTSDIAWVFRLHSTTTACDYNSQQVSATINGQTVYSATRKITIGLNSTLVLASGTLTGVAHNSDGSKTVATAFTWPKTGTGAYLPSATMSGSGNYQLDKIARASSFTIPASTAYGSTMSIAISSADASFTHDITITLPNRTKTYTGVVASQNHTIDINWLEGYTNGQEATGTVSVQTKQGSTLIGSAVSKTFKAPVPASAAPTVAIPAPSITSGLAGYSGAIVGVSSVVFSRNASAKYGASITTTSWTTDGTSASTTGFTMTPNKASQVITVAVVDTRGSTATATYTLTAVAYSAPAITRLTHYRCNSSGVADGEGQYIKFTPTFTYTNIDNKNTITGTFAISGGIQATTNLPNLVSGAERGPTGDNKILKTSSYVLTVVIKDSIGRTSTATETIPVSEVLFNFPSAGNALGIGMYSQGANRLDIGWNTDIKGDLSVGGTLNGFKMPNKATTTGESYHDAIVATKPDGVTEVGKYIDFHENATGSDYNVRLYAQDGILNTHQPMSVGNTLTVSGTITTDSMAYLKNGLYLNNNTPIQAYNGSGVKGTIMRLNAQNELIFGDPTINMGRAGYYLGSTWYEALTTRAMSMNNSNLDSILLCGTYQGYTGMTNAPVQDIAVMEVMAYSNDWILQRFTQILNNYTWQRVKVRGTTWSGWTRIN